MNHRITFTAELDKIEEDILYEVSDEALEAAAGNDALPSMPPARPVRAIGATGAFSHLVPG